MKRKQIEPKIKDIMPIFLIRKSYEIFILLLIVTLISFIPTLGRLTISFYPDSWFLEDCAIYNSFDHINPDCNPNDYWWVGIFSMILICIIGFIIYWIISDNWYKARSEAYERLNSEPKRSSYTSY